MDAIYWQALGLGLTNILQPQTFLCLLVGISVGLVIGALPAIGGVTGLIILLPFTYNLSGTEAFALLLGMYSTVAAGDAISSILVGVPGGVGSSATILDGYPLAKRGQAARALGAAYTSCALGGLIGAVILALSIPVVKPLVLMFGMPEYFALAALGLAMAGTLVGKSLAKGVAMACLGLLVSAIGAADFSGIPRFWFEITYLVQQPPVVAIVLGMFGIAEMLDLAISKHRIAQRATSDLHAGGTWQGIRDTLKEWWLVIRCSAIGVYIGILPGVGGSVVDWAAYGHAVQSSKDKSNFGKGDIRGVIAPEVANNADRGGALIPTLAFGIPGDFAMAIVLGALTIQGLKPGVEMLTTQLPVTFTMIWAIVIANIIGAALLMLWSRYVAKIAFVDGHIIVPAVLFFILMGSWLGTTTMGDLVVMLIAGIFGYWMKIAGWPRPPLIIGLVLGNMMENSLVVSMRTYDGFSFLLRPAVLIILALMVITVVLAVRARVKSSGRDAAAGDKDAFAGDLVEDNPMFSLPLALLVGFLFAGAIASALQMRRLDGAFPLWASAFGLLCVLLALRLDRRAVRQGQGQDSLPTALAKAAREVRLGRAALFLLHIALTVLGVYVLGHKLAIPLSLGLYVVVWGRYRWWAGLGAALATYAVVELLYDRTLSVNLQPPLWW
jgi:putative tricarboxylic transport membrane protein